MLAHCNQDCKTTEEIRIDLRTNQPICTKCNKEVTGMSSFAISSMISRRDIIEPKKQAFAFQCKNCNRSEPGVLAVDKKSVNCSVCGTKMDVTEYMLNTLRMLEKGNE